MTDPGATTSDEATLTPAPVHAPEPDFVVVSRDEVDEYASKGYQPGYVMLKP